MKLKRPYRDWYEEDKTDLLSPTTFKDRRRKDDPRCPHGEKADPKNPYAEELYSEADMARIRKLRRAARLELLARARERIFTMPRNKHGFLKRAKA